MKVPIIKNSVLNKFKQLENAAVIANSRYATVASYSYKKGSISGFMSGIGTLERKKEFQTTNSKFLNFFIKLLNKLISKNTTRIDINVCTDTLEIKHKPIFWNEEKTLSKIKITDSRYTEKSINKIFFENANAFFKKMA